MLEDVIKSFKHDGSSHRMWEYLTFLKEDEDYYYLAARRAKVIEHDGREWRAPEGALYILSKKRFFNVIVMFISEDIIEYYVNIASPCLKESDGVFSFVDYDLDLKKDDDGKVREIDWGEYEHNSIMYGYSPHLKFVVEATMKEVKSYLEQGKHPFNDKENLDMYNKYVSVIKA